MTPFFTVGSVTTNHNKLLFFVIALIPILLVSPSLLYAESGFVANPTNNTAGATAASDTTYNTYQNLGLGFNINYFKNMTVSEKTDNSSAFRTAHSVHFSNPHIGSANFKGIPHITGIWVLVTQATGVFGIPTSLDDLVRQVMLSEIDNSTSVVSKTKGSLNTLPTYRIELASTTNPENYTNSNVKIPSHTVSYFTVKDQLLYVIVFATLDKDIQNNFVPMVNKLIGSFQYN